MPSAAKQKEDAKQEETTDSADSSLQQAPHAWQILSGLAVSGFLLALPGGLLPLWGYHIDAEFAAAANYFLALGMGLVAGGVLARAASKVSLARVLSTGCFSAALSLLLLSVAAPPARFWYQSLALFVTGISAGIINTAVLEGMTRSYESDPATIALTGGMFFGGGSVLAALLLAQSFEDRGGIRLLAITALLPGAAGILLGRLRIPRPEVSAISLSRSMGDLRGPLVVLFALLLFFQFANEWSIAGWLPVFLIDRMGMSPATAVNLLAFYWFAVVAGRIAAARLLKVVKHGSLLALSAFCALFGCAAILASGSRIGVIVGLLLTGAGFSAIYPLVSERIASRFSNFHPGYFNGIFTFALLGGIFAPFALGHLAASAGLRVVPLAAMFGSCAVFALLLLIWLGHKVSGH